MKKHIGTWSVAVSGALAMMSGACVEDSDPAVEAVEGEVVEGQAVEAFEAVQGEGIDLATGETVERAAGPTATARSTGAWPNCPFEVPGRGLQVRVCDASGGRTINYAWTNNTGGQKCVTAYWWNRGASHPIDRVWLVPAGHTLWFHDAQPFTVFADATIEVKACNANLFTFRYKVGALTNANGFI